MTISKHTITAEVVLPGHWEDQGHWEGGWSPADSPEQVFYYPFDSSSMSAAGFTPSGGGRTTQMSGGPAHSGASAAAPYVLYAVSPNGPRVTTFTKTQSGLEVGRTYEWSCWVYGQAGGFTLTDRVKIGVDGIGESSWHTLTTTWTKITYAFAATGTSHDLVMTGEELTGGALTSGAYYSGFYVDDMLLGATTAWDPEHTWVPNPVYIEPAPVPLSVIDADITLDEGWSPYVQARLTCWTPDADLDLIDPREDLRVHVHLEAAFGDEDGPFNDYPRAGTSRDLSLTLRSREINHADGTMLLDLSSDEALLQDYALVSTSQANPPNLAPNIEIEEDLANIAAGSGVSIVRSSEQKLAGDYAVKATRLASGTPYVRFTAFPVSAGKTYTAAAHMRLGGALPDTPVNVMIQWYNGSDTYMDISVTSDNVTATNDGWVRPYVTATAPAGAASAHVWARPANSGDLTAGEVFYVDGITFTETDYLAPYANVRHLTEWVLERIGAALEPGDADGVVDPGAATWEPGVSAWDFLAPLVQAAGLRLWCDEQRRWFLTDPVDGTTGGLVLSQHSDVTLANELIARDDEWFDAVVVTYRWYGSENNLSVRHDVASEEGFSRVLTIVHERPWPGPGAAAAILRRAQGRGRRAGVDAVSDYHAAPGQALMLTLPNTPTLTGLVSSVTWRFPDDEMHVTSRDLIDTPPNSWLATPAGVAWEDVDPGIDWTEYEEA